jgi:hypothetical protein
MEVSGQLQALAALTSEIAPSTHRMLGGSGSGLDIKSPDFKLSLWFVHTVDCCRVFGMSGWGKCRRRFGGTCCLHCPLPLLSRAGQYPPWVCWAKTFTQLLPPTLKVKAECISATLATLSTSTRYRDPIVDSTSEKFLPLSEVGRWSSNPSARHYTELASFTFSVHYAIVMPRRAAVQRWCSQLRSIRSCVNAGHRFLVSADLRSNTVSRRRSEPRNVCKGRIKWTLYKSRSFPSVHTIHLPNYRTGLKHSVNPSEPIGYYMYHLLWRT